jgi:membrane protease YdiL (CAAX protease family)
LANTTKGKVESLLLGVVLVAAWHAIPGWGFRFLPRRELFESLGEHGYATLYDAATVVMPLLLCLGAPIRSGLSLGRWHECRLKVAGICLLAIALTAIVYPFTSRPFSGGPIGTWLISPLAQDLLFCGYLYGILVHAFPGSVHRRIPVDRAVVLTAALFALWHVPNFWGMSATYVSFQLLYTFIGGAWVLLARQLTGSIIPGVLTHMCVNFIASV